MSAFRSISLGLFLLLTACPCFAQCAGTTSCSIAANASAATVKAAVESANMDGTVLTIPAGTTTTSAEVDVAVSVNLTIQGAGSTTGSDSLGNPTGYSSTKTIFEFTGGTQGFHFTQANGKSLRFTGMSIESDGVHSPSNAIIYFGGTPQSSGCGGTSGACFRFDHNSLENIVASTRAIGFIDWLYGVADHNYFSEGAATVTNGMFVEMGKYNGDSAGYGDGSWADASNWGTAKFMFFENNTFNGGFANDCAHGGRQVWRYNTFNDTGLQGHEMEGEYQGCRAAEVYNNLYVGVKGDIDSSYVYEMRTGPALVWGNTSTNYQTLLDMANDRTDTFHAFGSAPPILSSTAMTGWGYCGTLGSGANLGPSDWDYSEGSGSPGDGFPCVQQVGRGKGDLLSGYFHYDSQNATRVNTTTSSVSWPHNQLEPVYEWLDKWTDPGEGGGQCTPNPATISIVSNREYYCYTLTWNGSSFTGTAFDGTVGTGSGLHSARPATCTAGLGGAKWTSPTGSYGVGYWSTDTNTLSVCTATNTWTDIYTPYTYPHPLDTNGGQANAPTLNPGTGSHVGAETVTISSTSGTVICHGTGSTPATNGDGSTCSSGSAITTNSGTNCVASSTVCGDITVSTTQTQYAVAGSVSLTDSAISSATYTITPGPGVTIQGVTGTGVTIHLF